MKKVLALALGLVMMLGLMTGCGKKYRTVDQIKESGQLVMLTEAGFEPYEYVVGGEYAGVDVDLAKMIADELGVELVIENMDFDLLVEALKNGKGDLVAAGMGYTEARAKNVDFSMQYVANGLLVIVPADSDITSTADLAGKTIAVQEGTTADTYAQDEIEGANVLSFKDAVATGVSVSSGKADAAILDIKPAEGVVNNSGGALKLLDEVLSEEDMCMAVGKGNTELLAIVNGILEKAVNDGTVEALVEYHMNATSN